MSKKMFLLPLSDFYLYLLIGGSKSPKKFRGEIWLDLTTFLSPNFFGKNYFTMTK